MTTHKLAIIINQSNKKIDFNENIMSFEEIHIFSNFNEYTNHNNVSYYCFNQSQLEFAKENKWKIHLSFLGDNIKNLEQFKDYEYDELFWFPTYNQINNESIEHFSTILNKFNKPICISFNPYLQKDIEPEIFRDFLIKIHSKFNNPIKLQEEINIDNEIFSKSNQIFIFTEQQHSQHDVVLGLFGDLPIISNDFNPINIKTILKNKDCSKCELNNNCIQRGLGYIIHSLKYNGCIGLKIL